MKADLSQIEEITTLICSICNATWKPKKKSGPPQRCPRCKSKLWCKSFRHTCCKCSYNWVSAFPSPDRCPKCQSKKWRQACETKAVPTSYLSKDKKIPILMRYDAGLGCVRIAMDLHITFSEVYDVVMETYPDQAVRL